MQPFNIWKDEKDKLTTLYISGELYIRNDGTYVKIDNDDYKALELLNHEYISTIIFEGIHFSLHEFAFKIIEKDNKFITNILVSKDLQSDYLDIRKYGKKHQL